MKIIKKLFEIYSSRDKKKKMSYLLKWKLQKEKIKYIKPMSGYIKKRKHHIPHITKDNYNAEKEKGIKCLNEYSRNVHLLKRSNSAIETKNENALYSNSLSINIAKVDSFSISRKKNGLRLNSHSCLSQDKDKDKDASPNQVQNELESRSQLNNEEKNSKKKKKNPTNRGIKTNTSKLRKEEKKKFFNSLYETSNRLKENLFKLEKEKEEKINAACPFKPMLYKSKSNITIISAPFITRLHKYQQIKTKKFNDLREEIESQIPKPQAKQSLTSRSKEDISTEMMAYYKKKKEKLRQMEIELYLEKGITFKPALNDDKNRDIKDTITVRNKNFLEMRDEKLTNICDKEGEECTFVPFINTPSIEHNPEESNDVCIRLYDYRNRYAANREYIQKYYEVNYSFKPSISKNTKQILANRHQKKISLKRQTEKKLKVICERDRLELNEEIPSSLAKLYSLHDKAKEKGKSKGSHQLQSGTVNDSVKMLVGSFSDKRALELAQMYISVDASLEQFQRKLQRAKQNNRLINQNKLIKENRDLNKNNLNYKKNNKRQLMKHLDYYGLLE